MKKPLLLLIILVLASACGQGTTKKSSKRDSGTKLTTYYLIRHAEKDRSDPENNNPDLTEAGITRAKNWATYFDSIPLDQIYSTNYNRTQQTASFTASKQNVGVKTYEPSQLYSEEFKSLTTGQTVLVVGHSNTTPKFVNAIIGKNTYPDMDDDDNATLYQVIIVNDQPKVVVIKVK